MMIHEKSLEAHMIGPVRELLLCGLGMTVVAEEFSAGYGRADLIGARLRPDRIKQRSELGISETLDHHLLIKVILAIPLSGRITINALQKKVAVSEATLKKSILPRLDRLGIIFRSVDGTIMLRIHLPSPASKIIAVEAKQTKWKQAILQARRYTFFANQTYIAVWNGTAKLVERGLLYRHRLGLIAVDYDCAQVLVEAPTRLPRAKPMNRYCAEFLLAHQARQTR